MNDDFNAQETPVSPEEKRSPTPTYLRVLALLGALAVIGLSIAYAWSIATGGIFWL